MDELTYEKKLTLLKHGVRHRGLSGYLFVEGLGWTSAFNLDRLLNLGEWNWVPKSRRYLYRFQPSNPSELKRLIEDNAFNAIVLSGVHTADTTEDSVRAFRPLADSCIKPAAERGAMLVLFAASNVEYLTKKLGLSWKASEYVRSQYVAMPAVDAGLRSAGVPTSLPYVFEAKASLLSHVPTSEAWWATTEESTNESLMPQDGLCEGLVAVAVANVGAGKVAYFGDANAEEDSCKTAAQLMRAIGPPLGPPPQPRSGACAACGAQKGGLLKCGKCMGPCLYCNVECQRSGWVAHKPNCK